MANNSTLPIVYNLEKHDNFMIDCYCQRLRLGSPLVLALASEDPIP